MLWERRRDFEEESKPYDFITNNAGDDFQFVHATSLCVRNKPGGGYERPETPHYGGCSGFN